MIDWSLIVGFDWDDGNARKRVEKHDVGQAETEQIFFNDPSVIASDTGHSLNEVRFHALGQTDFGGLLHVTFTLRSDNTKLRIISSRPMSRKEREVYERD
ncbi:BrnT family toxin [Rhizobium sp. G21]|uniref:BrnT family toxin n=1 Tax=Rhizobium sp. G21 TaxID=2758439 RepID=UPI0016029C8D|nr:BrnT family toxin [Rhizobium sp. G21]MBB1250677.1 BrnT family toxin [Rhizobium sp. G21]